MKNLFAAIKNTIETNFNKFLIRELSKENETRLNDLSEEGNTLSKEKLPPKWISVFSKVLIYLGLLLSLGFFAAAIKDFARSFDTIGIFLYIGLGLIAIGVGIYIFVRNKTKKSNSDPDVKEYVAETTKTIKECLFELNIPETAAVMDVFSVLMKKNKKGEEVFSKLLAVPFVNMEFKLFLENDLFCFGANDAVIGLPINSIKQIVKIKKRTPIVNWNKNELYNSPKYKEHKMYLDGPIVWSRYYYEIDLNIENEEYCFYIPCYEKDVFLETIGIDVPVIEK